MWQYGACNNLRTTTNAQTILSTILKYLFDLEIYKHLT